MHKPKDVRIIKTADGSHTLIVDEINETYHSTHGALTESQYVFIEKGLSKIKSLSIRILEIGFGTGLNALLTWKFAKQNGICVEYHSLEAFPLEEEIYSRLNYPEKDMLMELHGAAWNQIVGLGQNFSIAKWRVKWENFEPEKDKYDLVFYDAFAPSRQAEMWDPDLLKKMQNSMKRGAIMVTYCAQGVFKRNLNAIGMEVHTLPGPPGKAEMVRAIKD